MKKLKYLSIMMLAMMALPLMLSCSKDDEEEFGGNTNVIVNENGTTSNGSIFSAVGDNVFYLDYVKYSIEEGHLVVSGYDKTGFKGIANIVASITYKGSTYEVLEIGNEAFSGCKSLTSVTISNSVTSIGGYAFSDCENLNSVVIGDNVVEIGANVFYSCGNLTSVIIPNSVKYLGESAFMDCEGLASVIIGSNVMRIAERVFDGCCSLDSVTIPNSVKYIGLGVFDGCSNLNSLQVESGNTVYDSRENCNAIIATITNALVRGCNKTTIPNTVKSIKEYAFSGSSDLTSLVIPNSVISIGEYAFQGCNSLTSLQVESGNTVYDSRENCNAIIETETNTLVRGCNNTNIPSSIISIGENAFFDCDSLTSVVIPNSVRFIENNAFAGCNSLTSLIIEDGTETLSFGNNSFENYLLKKIYLGRNVGSSAFRGCSSLTSLTIGDLVTSIPNSAFESCVALTSVTIPCSVKSVGNNAFSGCSSLTSATIEDGTEILSLYNSPFGNSSVENLYLGRNVNNSAFEGCNSLVSVTIGNLVTSIESSTFYDCSSLTSLIIEDGAEVLTFLINSAFRNCPLENLYWGREVSKYAFRKIDEFNDLTSITIGNSVKKMVNAFAYCSSLRSIHFLSTTPPYIDDLDFYYASPTIYVPQESIEAYKSMFPWMSFNNIVGE